MNDELSRALAKAMQSPYYFWMTQNDESPSSIAKRLEDDCLQAGALQNLPAQIATLFKVCDRWAEQAKEMAIDYPFTPQEIQKIAKVMEASDGNR